MLLEKYSGDQKLHCVFVDPEEVYNGVPREELCDCMRKSGVAEKYVRRQRDSGELCRRSDR